MVHATAVAVLLGQPGPRDVLHQGRLRMVACTLLLIGVECLLASSGVASALCRCYRLHWWDTNPVGHPNSLHMGRPAPGQSPAVHRAAGHCCVPVRLTPVLASCYCSPTLLCRQVGFSTLNLARTLIQPAKSPFCHPVFGHFRQGFAVRSSKALRHLLQRNSSLKSRTFRPSKNYTVVVTIYMLAYKART